MGALPVAVPGIFVADGAASSFADRGHSLPSLDSAIGGGRVAPQLRYTWIMIQLYPCNKHYATPGCFAIIQESFEKSNLKIGNRTKNLKQLQTALESAIVYLVMVHIKPINDVHLREDSAPDSNQNFMLSDIQIPVYRTV